LCEPCEKGSFTNELNSTSCELCAKGYFQSETGQTLCVECTKGSYCNTTGCDTCQPCDYGQESLVDGADRCTLCKPGYHKANRGYDLCVACAVGYYSKFSGQRYCAQCPGGYYCPSPDSGPVVCPSEAICPDGSVEFIKCTSPFYYVKSVEDKSCGITVTLYIVIVGSISAFIFLIVGSFFLMRYQRTKRRSNYLQNQRLLAKSPNPLYVGY
jgi:hypothetical protein